MSPPVDDYGRPVTHLRVSVTARCNLRCPYCHHEGASSGADNDLPMEFFCAAVRAAAAVGIRRALKITGGEPLLRDDLERLVSCGVEAGFGDVSLVTNGTLLDARRARSLAAAGLARLNIGCDAVTSSVLPKTYERVRTAVEAALSAGLAPVKLNVVLMRGINDGEVDRLLKVSAEKGVVVQFIELVEADEAEFYRRHHIDLGDLESELVGRATHVERRDLQNRTVVRLADGATAEFVRPSHPGFCARCRKIRLTHDGRVKPCLLSEHGTVRFSGEESLLEAVRMRRPYNGADGGGRRKT